MATNPIFQPKLLTTLKDYNLTKLYHDLLSGLVVAIIALPLSIAFGISSKVSPAQGLLTAVVAGFCISVFGGSRVQIGGPTGAFIVVVAGIVAANGIEGLIVATLMAGILLIGFGVLKLGVVIRYIPEAVVIGFTAGIALIIMISQIQDGLGFIGSGFPDDLWGKAQFVATHVSDINPWAAGLTVATVAGIYAFRVWLPKVPGAFVVLVAISLAVGFWGLPVATIGSTFGVVRLSVTPLDFSHLTLMQVAGLLPAAFSIAFLGAIESLLSAVVADTMIGGKHRPNTELIAQGIANIASAFVGGIPATGAIARTAANVQSGGRTPMAGIAHAVFLLLILLLIGPLAGFIPLPVLAGILIFVAINMADWPEFWSLLRSSRTEALVLLVTFFLTVFVNLMVAIAGGLIISVALFIRASASAATIRTVDEVLHRPVAPCTDEDEADNEFVMKVPAGVRVLELNGMFFFGAAAHFEEVLRDAIGRHSTVILRFANLDGLDASGLRVLKRILRHATHLKTTVLFCEVPKRPADELRRANIATLVRQDTFDATLGAVLGELIDVRK